MSLFPIFLKLDGRRCLVVGAGKVGEPKVESLLSANAQVEIVAPETTKQSRNGLSRERLRCIAGIFTRRIWTAYFWSSPQLHPPSVNSSVFAEAQSRDILCNSVDDPEHCDFFYPAVVRRGDFQVAISTAGHSPALAQRLRIELEEQFGPEYTEWVEELGRVRHQLFSSDLDPENRRRLLHELASQEAFEAAQCRPIITKE